MINSHFPFYMLRGLLHMMIRESIDHMGKVLETVSKATVCHRLLDASFHLFIIYNSNIKLIR